MPSRPFCPRLSCLFLGGFTSRVVSFVASSVSRYVSCFGSLSLGLLVPVSCLLVPVSLPVSPCSSSILSLFAVLALFSLARSLNSFSFPSLYLRLSSLYISPSRPRCRRHVPDSCLPEQWQKTEAAGQRERHPVELRQSAAPAGQPRQTPCAARTPRHESS